MIHAMKPGTIVASLIAIVMLALCALMIVHGAVTPAAVWKLRGEVVLLVNGLTLALCIPSVFRFVHWATLAKYWLFPGIDGEWTAEIHSNWPRVRRMFEAAQGRGVPFNAILDERSPEEIREGLIAATVTIRSSLLVVTMTLAPTGSSRVSRTCFVRPSWRKPDLPELSYVYQQVDHVPAAMTDSTKHFGAGIVRYDPDSGVMSGDYWTQRREEAGLNTAGTIRMTRPPAKPVRNRRT